MRLQASDAVRGYPPGFRREPGRPHPWPAWLRVVAFLASVGLVGILALGAAFYRWPLWFADLSIRLHLRQQGVRSEYVEVDGYRLHFYEALPPHGAVGTPLVLVHGLGARGEDWSGLLPGLAAQGFHVYAPDLLGYGRSPRPHVDYTIGLEEKVVTGFMQAMHVQRADIGGWSMGGWIAAKLALDHPQTVRRLVLYDSAGIYFPPPYTATLFTPNEAAGVWTLQQRLSPNAKPLPGFVARAAVRKLQFNAPVIQSSVGAMLGGRELLDFRLPALTQPTLIVWGSSDALIPVAVGERMHRLIPGSSLLLVEGCGHLAPAECAKPVLAGTLGFLKDPAPAGGERHVAGR